LNTAAAHVTLTDLVITRPAIVHGPKKERPRQEYDFRPLIEAIEADNKAGDHSSHSRDLWPP
jgi:hypothetical protein